MKTTIIKCTLVFMQVLFTMVLNAQTGAEQNGSPQLMQDTDSLSQGKFIPGMNAENTTTLNGIATVEVHDPTHHNANIYLTPMSTYGDSSMVFFAENSTATYGMYWLYAGSGGDEMEIWTYSSGSKIGPHFKVKRGTGDVAIGDLYATGYKLSVSGKIICTELRVNDVTSWPDYVFKKGYPLMPVDKLEDYVEKNGHLPNVPAADEIESSGLEVGEMQRLMMEKIEELSLYIIQQQKEIQELRDQLSTMER